MEAGVHPMRVASGLQSPERLPTPRRESQPGAFVFFLKDITGQVTESPKDVVLSPQVKISKRQN